jgi:glycosyltransferase involved in cell wall biosynthesis
MSEPRVSIGLPVYNGERYLAGAIESLLNQQYSDFELIISDNASGDGTPDICHSYAAKDARIRYSRNAVNIGSAPNYRRVFELARGSLFKWVSHDDWYYPQLVQRCVEVFDRAPSSVVLVYPLCELIDEDGVVFGRPPDRVATTDDSPRRRFAHVLKHVSYAYPVYGLIRTECLRRTRLTGRVAYWDESLLAELALYGQILEVSEVLTQQRSHGGNAVARASADRPTDARALDRLGRQALRRWTDPSRANTRSWLPAHEEHYWEYAKRVHHSPLSRLEKLACYGTIGVLCYWLRLRKIGGNWKRKLRERTARIARA